TPVMGPLQEQELEGKGSKKIVVMDISGIITEKQDDKTFGPDYPSMPARIREELN
ncbi:MAG: signal peptide peptidase SppA, partial [Gammaproteobacteria bacterium]|nr:signal peptide peptidase SppA [Gammaproteobacteria bacterium]